jgi:ABC-2 type transport system permease protein
MNKIIAMMQKDLLLRFSSKSEWLFFLILPIVFTVVLAGGSGPSGDNRIRLIVVDQSGSTLAQELIDELAKSDTVRPDVLAIEAAESQFSQRNTAAMLIIPETFNLDQIRQGSVELELRQLPNNTNAMVSARSVQAVMGLISASVDIAGRSLEAAESIRPFETDAERQSYFNGAMQEAQVLVSAAPDRVESAVGNTPNSIEYDPRANSSAGQLITWVFVPLLGISGMFAYERQLGTLRRLLTTPTQRATFLVGSISGQVLTALVQMTLLIVFGMLVMKLNWGQNLAALALMLVSAALAAAALGTTLGTFVKTEGQASGLSIMLGMTMALLGGCWYPIELFPQVVRDVVKILPTTWAMQGMLDIVLRNQDLPGVLPEASVLMGFALIFFTIGIWRFRYE